jgi:putative SOS response-associated peptidase YedK
MCGRVRLSSDVGEIKLVCSIPPHRPSPNIAPSWNVAPTDPLPIVRYDAKAGELSLDMCAGAWCRSGRRTSKSAFPTSTPKPKGSRPSPPSARRSSDGGVSYRWIIYYEWARTATSKQPYAIALADRGLMALAGLWET